MAKSKLTNQIRRLRFEKDEMTQQELANRVRVTRQTIIALEGNKYAPSLPLAFRVARVFDVLIEEVFKCDQYDQYNPYDQYDPADQHSEPPAEVIN